MEFSAVLGFFKILKESIKLLSKNGKYMASITILSLLLPSILFLFFINFYQSLTNHLTNSVMNSSDSTDSNGFDQQIIVHSLLLIAVEIAVLIAYTVFSHISGIATILVSALSYTDKNLSLQNLLSRIKATWRTQLSNTFRRPKNPGRFALLGVVLAYILATLYGSSIAIVVAIAGGISVCVYRMYSSVSWALSHVVLIVEDVYEGAEALEKAEQLVKGQRHHGFMINLFFNLVALIFFLGCWMVVGDKGTLSLNLTVYGLIFVNSLSLVKIFGCTAYTVLYFECKKFHGQDVDVLANFEYNKLPTTNLGSDVVLGCPVIECSK